MSFKDFEELKASFEEICPGITEEIAGFAESLEVPPEKISLYGAPIYESGNCSQIAITPKITVDNHTYVARNYEFYHEKDDLRLITTRIKGKPKTIGFSSFLLGRSDGLNECRFCITFTGGGTFKTKPNKKGYTFFLLTRSLLDNCKTVAEAVTHLKKIPVHGFWNFLMTDKKGNAALAQFFDGEYAIKEINKDSEEKILFSGNQYWLPEILKYQEYAGDWILKNSKKRHELINKTFAQAKGKASKETIRALLSKEIYEGLAGHYYTDYFGTLYSVIFDLTTLTVDI